MGSKAKARAKFVVRERTFLVLGGNVSNSFVNRMAVRLDSKKGPVVAANLIVYFPDDKAVLSVESIKSIRRGLIVAGINNVSSVIKEFKIELAKLNKESFQKTISLTPD